MWSTWFEDMIYLFSPFCRNKIFVPKIRQIISLNRAKGKKTHSKKHLPKDGLRIWSAYPSHSAERNVFGQQWQYMIYLFCPQNQVDHILPLSVVLLLLCFFVLFVVCPRKPQQRKKKQIVFQCCLPFSFFFFLSFVFSFFPSFPFLSSFFLFLLLLPSERSRRKTKKQQQKEGQT